MKKNLLMAFMLMLAGNNRHFGSNNTTADALSEL